MVNTKNLLSQGFDCIKSNDKDGAKDILNQLKNEDGTPQLKYEISKLLMDLGDKTKKVEYIDEAIANFEDLYKYGFEDINFFLGTSYFLKHDLSSEPQKYLTKDFEPILLKSKKFLLKELSQNPNVDLRKTYINLANVYNNIGRELDGIEYYEHVIAKTGSAYALLNKGISLYRYAMFIDNPIPILSEAYAYFVHLFNHPKSSDDLKRKSKFYIDDLMRRFSEEILKDDICDDLIRPTNDSFNGFMINFCLDYRLYLNLCNYCQRCQNAIGDSIVMEKIIGEVVDNVEDDLFSKLTSYLNQLKMDYVSARFLLILSQYEGFDLDIITNDVYIIDNQFREENDIRVQLLKDSFKNFFNILDKIAYFINDYLELGISPKKVDFRRVWYNNNKKTKIHEKLILLDNKGLTALYDIFLDVEYGNEKEYLRNTRNDLTHKYLRIVREENGVDKTLEELKYETIEIAILAKNAIIYLMRLVKIHECQKEEDLGVEFIDDEYLI